MADSIHIKGFSALQKMLETLPAKVEGNILRSALRQGAKTIAEEAKAQVPVRYGDLRDSIRTSVKMKNGKVMAVVKAGNKKAWYWRFVEFGTGAHKITGKDGKALAIGGGVYKSVDHPGAKPTPFMRPAMDGKSAEALQAIGEQIKKRLTKAGLEAADIDIEVEES